MNKATLSTMRVNSDSEIALLNAKNEIIEQASGIKHNIDIEELVNGGKIATVWVDAAVVDSGEYAIKMLTGLDRIMLACDILEQGYRDGLALDQIDFSSLEAKAAGNQVKDFFGL